MSFALILPAAGSGERLGERLPKALVELGGVPLFIHSLKVFLSHTECAQAVIAAPAEYIGDFLAAVSRHVHDNRIDIVEGGSTRFLSVGNALTAVNPDIEIVMVHDAARPFVTHDLVDRMLAALKGNIVAAAPGIPVTDTLKRVEQGSGNVKATVSREDLFFVQTPQAVFRELLAKAYAKIGTSNSFTDDISLMETDSANRVIVVEGDSGNFKITTAEDLRRARKKLLL